MNRAIKINTNPVANGYASSAERIIEYSAPDPDGKGMPIGGLISFALGADGRLVVSLYRHDSDGRLDIIVSTDNGAMVASHNASGDVLITRADHEL